MSDVWIYDIETYPNIFSIGLLNDRTGQKFTFEYSWRRNDIPQLIDFLSALKLHGDYMCGFNNIGFDYPVLHYIIENQDRVTPFSIYQFAMKIINTPWDRRFDNIIWDRDQYVKQLDLYKIHHFDNVSRATSLKTLEFNMRSQSVEDLPYEPGTVLNFEQMDKLIWYMWVDITETVKFFKHSEHQIAFRRELTEKYDRNFMNHNDTKIGKDYFIMQLEKTMVGFDKKRQTKRESINLADVIFPYVQFERPEFQRIQSWLQSQVITETKGALTDVNCTINGFQFDFGTGGIHGSVEPGIIESSEDYVIEDWDVASYYPNLAIKNGLYPEHLGLEFCQIYEDVYLLRKQYAKKTTENAMLKLALNGVYGDSNSKYSCFYDPQYTMSITINGQLLLCMLAEQLMKCQQLEMIQINTDGLTVRYPRSTKDWVHSVANWWMEVTRLELENVEYNRMFIRDVNNYIGEYTDGKLKRKGAYCYESKLDNPFTQDLDWNQNHSSLVVQKAAEAALIRGEDIRTFIAQHADIYDFMLRTKVPRSSKLVAVDYEGNDRQLQNNTRYYISALGDDLVKIMPPTKSQLAKDPEAPHRRMHINKGWKVSVCNDMNNYVDSEVEFDWYVKEAEALVNPLVNGRR